MSKEKVKLFYVLQSHRSVAPTTTQHASHCEVSVPHPLTIILLFSSYKYSNRRVKAGDGGAFTMAGRSLGQGDGWGSPKMPVLFHNTSKTKQHNRLI